MNKNSFLLDIITLWAIIFFISSPHAHPCNLTQLLKQVSEQAPSVPSLLYRRTTTVSEFRSPTSG